MVEEEICSFIHIKVALHDINDTTLTYSVYIYLYKTEKTFITQNCPFLNVIFIIYNVYCYYWMVIGDALKAV